MIVKDKSSSRPLPWRITSHEESTLKTPLITPGTFCPIEVPPNWRPRRFSNTGILVLVLTVIAVVQIAVSIFWSPANG